MNVSEENNVPNKLIHKQTKIIGCLNCSGMSQLVQPIKSTNVKNVTKLNLYDLNFFLNQLS
jgi:hypothetical protein